MPETNLQLIGFILIVIYISLGLDDLIWDIYTIIKGFFNRKPIVDIKTLNRKPPKLIALCVGAWREEDVIADVIENIIASQIYPQSMYHIFIGVYPNDLNTIAEVKRLKNKYSNVHLVVNFKKGPTTKAQNLNYVFGKLRDFEKDNNCSFSAINIHDAEDIVHPYEFLVTNHLIDDYPALQFPVFPLMKMPTLDNFFKTLTINTYADEFAENHFITMVNRHKSGAFVPSAGTGFSLSKETFQLLGEEVLPMHSLTEDYKLSLTLYEKGIQMYYVMERIKRVNSNDKIIWDYIATRSIFPSTFKTAVRQKTRWITGITMQSYEMKKIFKNNMSFVGKYSIYKDQKAKIINLLSPIGYPMLVYFIVSLFRPMETIYPTYSLAWYLSLLVTLIAIERQIMRGIALYNIYGLRSTFYGVLFPPLLPIRILWGNVINFVSTARAFLKIIISKIQIERNKYNDKIEAEDVKKTKSFTPIVKWDKTDHSFVSNEVLLSYHRKLGDALIEREYLTPKDVSRFLKTKIANETFGEYLINNNVISETQLIESLSHIEGLSMINNDLLDTYDLKAVSNLIDKTTLEEAGIIPILRRDKVIVLACSYENYNEVKGLVDLEGYSFISVLAKKSTIQYGIQKMFKDIYYPICYYCENNNELTLEQIIIIKNYSHILQMKENDVAKSMGLSQI